MHGPYWEEVISGRRWKDTWEDNQEYFIGDL